MKDGKSSVRKFDVSVSDIGRKKYSESTLGLCHYNN